MPGQETGRRGSEPSWRPWKCSENIAYIMAKHADKDNVPASPEEWLDSFNTFSIYEIFPKIIKLWDLNMEGMSTSKKKK